MKINKDKLNINTQMEVEDIALENGEIVNTDVTEPVVIFNKTKENTTLINPIEFISKFLEQNGYPPNMELAHIEYDSSVNNEFDFEIIRESNHDGTLLFTMCLLEDVVEPIIRKQVVHKDYTNEPLKDIAYTVGDIALESIFDNYRQYEKASLPVKCEYIYE